MESCWNRNYEKCSQFVAIVLLRPLSILHFVAEYPPTRQNKVPYLSQNIFFSLKIYTVSLRERLPCSRKNVPNLSHLTFPLFPGIVLYTHFLSQKT